MLWLIMSHFLQTSHFAVWHVRAFKWWSWHYHHCHSIFIAEGQRPQNDIQVAQWCSGSDWRLVVGCWNASHSTAGYFSEVDDYLWYVTTTQVNSALHPFGVAESSTIFGWDKGRKVTSARWQVTLCISIWYVISNSGEVKFTNYIPFITPCSPAILDSCYYCALCYSLAGPVYNIVTSSSPWSSCASCAICNHPSKMCVQRFCDLIIWLKYCSFCFWQWLQIFCLHCTDLIQYRFIGSVIFPADLWHTPVTCHLEGFNLSVSLAFRVHDSLLYKNVTGHTGS